MTPDVREEAAFAALFADPAVNPGRRWPPDWETDPMRIGVTCFLTDRDIAPADLARAAEERGFASLYLPEHTHLPVRADTPPALVEGVRAEDYKRSLDPFVGLATAAAVTSTLRLGTGVSLVAQHDPIVLAKQVATLDHLSAGRVDLGIGFGWNRAEAADHGVDFADRRAVAREHVLCMQALWRDDPAEFHGRVRRPRPLLERARVRCSGPGCPVLLGGVASPGNFAAIAEYGDGWLPVGGSGLTEALPALRRAFEDAGRDPDLARVVPFGTVPTEAKLEHFAGLGIDEVVLRVPSGPTDRGPDRPRRPRRPRRTVRRHRCLSRSRPDPAPRPTPGSPRRGPSGRPWSGDGREELAAAVRRLIELTVTSTPAPGALAAAAARVDAVSRRAVGRRARRGPRARRPPRRDAGGPERRPRPDGVDALRHGGRHVQPGGPARSRSASSPPKAYGTDRLHTAVRGGAGMRPRCRHRRRLRHRPDRRQRGGRTPPARPSS